MMEWKVWYAFFNSENEYVEDNVILEADTLAGALRAANMWIDGMIYACEIQKVMITGITLVKEENKSVL